jgi:hypothetical protein
LGSVGKIRNVDDRLQLLFFQEWQGLRFLEKITNPCRTEDYRNVDGLIGQIVASGKATLNELRTVYSLEDAMLIWEAEIIPKYNEYLINEHYAKKMRKGK